MPSDSITSSEERLLYHLERALKHLYDPAILRASPLAPLLRADQRADAVFALRDILLTAIESLLPQPHAPGGTRAWRVYQILHRRYTEQQSQKQVAADLGLSIRQLQREERSARRVLADYLRAEYGLEDRLAHLPNVPAEANEDSDSAEPSASTRDAELQQLDSAVPIEATDLGQVIQEILAITRPLTQAHHVAMETAIASNLPTLPLKTLLLKQALLEIIGTMTRDTTNGQIIIAATRAEQSVEIRISGAPRVDSSDRAVFERFEIAEQLIGLCGGALRRVTTESTTDAPTLRVEIVFPIQERIKVLVIDDNADARLLFQRYLEGQRYHVIGAADGRQGIKLAQDLQPDVILLDIMMPEHDGWEILGQLRVHPRTRAIPVFVCTILAQEELALALGAAQFLRKPINPAALLLALERQLDPTRQESG